MKSLPKKTVGAWLVHHSSKLQQISNVTSFDSIALAGKAGLLLSALCESESQSTLSKEKVDILARSAGISPILELPTLLNKLENQRLISVSSKGDTETLGLTTSAVLQHTHDIFISSNPQKEEFIAIDIAEKTSQHPCQSSLLKEYISDIYETTNLITEEIFSQSEEIGFIDHEELDDKKIYFNGNLFRTNDPQKMLSIVSSLNSQDAACINQINQELDMKVVISYDDAKKILGDILLTKVLSIGLFDVNSVSNDISEHYFITKPSSFGKYGNPLQDDALDLVKAFVTSLHYGINYSGNNRGRITMLPQLMKKLIAGEWVGPATAIGQDYKILELKRVIEVKSLNNNLYSMRLLKKEVGELALQALQEGDISEASLPNFGSAKLIKYHSPEYNREIIRKNQSHQSRNSIVNMLRTLRSK